MLDEHARHGEEMWMTLESKTFKNKKEISLKDDRSTEVDFP